MILRMGGQTSGWDACKSKPDYNVLTFREQWNGSQQSCVVAQFGYAHLHLAPRRPGILAQIGFNIRDDQAGALHHASSHDNDFRIIGMNQAHCICCPYIETPVPNGYSNPVAAPRLLEELFESDMRIF